MSFLTLLCSLSAQYACAHFEWNLSRQGKSEPFMVWSRQEVIQFPSKLKPLRHLKGPEVPLFSIIEAYLQEEDTQVDLLTFFDKENKSLAMPRAFSLKYKVKLAISWGKARLLLPEKLGLERDELPIEEYRAFTPVRILLSRANETYAPFVGVHRNPSLMAGQKLFTQHCLACHEARDVPTGLKLVEGFLSSGHPGPLKVPKQAAFRQKLERYADHLAKATLPPQP